MLEGGARRRARTSSCACARRSTASACGSTSRGSADQVEGNLNCPLAGDQVGGASSRSACSPTPTPRRRAGAHRPIEVAAPEGCVLNARPPAAVAAGNVETSSRVADLVIEALAGATDAPAQGQGTMNNLTLAGDGLHLLRDDRRRPGRLPGRRRAQRDPRGDVEHAEHAGRGPRDRVPGAGARAGVRRGAAAPARTAAATGSCARSRRWSR